MKPMEYHQFDVIFVIENTASCGVYLNEMKTSYIHPALEYFSSGLEDLNLFGIVLFKTSQTISASTYTYGPFGSQSFLKTLDSLELIGGRSESNANLAEGLATALVCFQDLDKRRDKDTQTNKHCILISNSPPYSIPVSECYEYEGKTVEQLAAIFSEKNINLSIISPRKIPVLYEIFEKSGGDLGITAKNYSKDPRHLVLLKGFSLKELIHDKRAESPSIAQNQPIIGVQQQQQQQPTNMPSNQQQQQPPQMVPNNDMNPMVMQNNPNAIRPMNPSMRPTNPMMQGGPQQPQQPGMQQGMGNPMGNFVQQNQQQRGPNPQQRWIAPNQPNQPRQTFMGSNMMPGTMMTNQQPNQPQSALISQLTQPPSAMNPQQQNMVRMTMQNQQQNQPMMQNQPQNPNIANPMQNSQMMGQNQQGGLMQPNQQTGQINQPQQQQMPPRERIWRGILEWNDKHSTGQGLRQVPCEIYASISKETNEVEIRGDTWPSRLIMQLMPRNVISSVGGQLLRDSKIVIFQWGNSEAFESLSKVMANGFAGCVHFTNQTHQCDVKILILLYMADKKSYYGFVPNDQTGYVEKLRRVIQQSKITQFSQNQQGGPPQQPQQQQMQQQQQQQQQQAGPRPMGPMGSMQPNPMGGNQNVGNMMGPQGDSGIMFNQQMQMQGNPNMVANQQRMTRPNMMQNNNLRHLLQQQQTQFRPQMGGVQQQQQQQMQGGRPGFDGMDQQYDMNFPM